MPSEISEERLDVWESVCKNAILKQWFAPISPQEILTLIAAARREAKLLANADDLARKMLAHSILKRTIKSAITAAWVEKDRQRAKARKK